MRDFDSREVREFQFSVSLPDLASAVKSVDHPGIVNQVTCAKKIPVSPPRGSDRVRRA